MEGERGWSRGSSSVEGHVIINGTEQEIYLVISYRRVHFFALLGYLARAQLTLPDKFEISRQDLWSLGQIDFEVCQISYLVGGTQCVIKYSILQQNG